MFESATQQLLFTFKFLTQQKHNAHCGKNIDCTVNDDVRNTNNIFFGLNMRWLVLSFSPLVSSDSEYAAAVRLPHGIKK